MHVTNCIHGLHGHYKSSREADWVKNPLQHQGRVPMSVLRQVFLFGCSTNWAVPDVCTQITCWCMWLHTEASREADSGWKIHCGTMDLCPCQYCACFFQLDALPTELSQMCAHTCWCMWLHMEAAQTLWESSLEADSGRKVHCGTRDLCPYQYCTWFFSWVFYQLSCPWPQCMQSSIKVDWCWIYYYYYYYWLLLYSTVLCSQAVSLLLTCFCCF